MPAGHGCQENDRQSELAVDTLDYHVTVVHPDQRKQPRSDPNASQREALQVLVREPTRGNPMLTHPLLLAAIGIEQKVRIVSFPDELEGSHAIVRRKICNEGDPRLGIAKNT